MLVRALVQRALEPPARLVAGLQQPRARGGELRPRRVVGERLADQLREPDQPPLAAGRQRLLVGRRGDERAPEFAVGAAPARRPTLQPDRASSPPAARRGRGRSGRPAPAPGRLRAADRAVGVVEVELGVDRQPRSPRVRQTPTTTARSPPSSAPRRLRRPRAAGRSPPRTRSKSRSSGVSAGHEHRHAQQRGLLLDRLDVLTPMAAFSHPERPATSLERVAWEFGRRRSSRSARRPACAAIGARASFLVIGERGDDRLAPRVAEL